MNNIKIMQGIIIKDNQTNIKYRIINVKSEYIVLINMDTMNHCDIIRLNNIIVYNKISNETFSIINEPNNTYIIDEETLPEHTRLKFKRNKTIIDTINKIYAPDYIELTQKRNKTPILNTNICLTNNNKSKEFPTFSPNGTSIFVITVIVFFFASFPI